MFKFLYSPIFGLFSDFMYSYLKGIGCTGEVGSVIANQVGILMLISVIVAYFLLYHVIDSAKYFRKIHVWITAAILFVFNFIVPLLWVKSDISSGNFCELTPIYVIDAIGFAILNGIWSFVFFAILTSLPFFRARSKNLSQTTLYKP